MNKTERAVYAKLEYLSTASLVKRFGISKDEIWRIMKKGDTQKASYKKTNTKEEWVPPKKWTEEETAELIELYKAGAKKADLEKAFDRSYEAIQMKIKRLRKEEKLQ